jgi:nucleotide-binding universal stress UspA family protein
MINPLRSEAEAFRFLIASIGYFGAIVIASVAGGKWAGLGVFVFLSAVVVAWWARARRVERPERTAPRPHAEGERRILVVANETVGGHTLRSLILERSLDVREEVLVVTPALNSPLKHWVSDEDDARAAAQERLDESLARLAEAGVEARGEVGDGDPVQAIEDALRTFGADEIVISTHPPGRSNWLERGVVDKARERFPVPITHVVVDLDREKTELLGCVPQGSDPGV